MITVTDEEFGALVEAAVAGIPERFASHLENVAFRVADLPTQEQLVVNGVVHRGQTLLGLYEGVPLPRRGGGYSGMVPDVITVFKQPHEMMANDAASLGQNVQQTVWHEVAHYFGLNHGQINALS